MSNFTVLNFFESPVPLVLSISQVAFLPQKEERPPALVFRCTLTQLNEELEEEEIPGVDPDAWFKCMIRPRSDGDMDKFGTKVASILQAMNLDVPIGENCSDFLRLSAGSISNEINRRLKDDDRDLPRLYGPCTTVKGKPRWVTLEDGRKVLSHDSRFVNIMYVDREMSRWFNV